jgi:hypothetical protein
MCTDSAYESIATRHGLSEVLAGGDWQVTARGDIATTSDGNPKFGNDRCNATHRLVVRWCFNTRVLETLLDLVAVDNLRKQTAEAEREAVAGVAFANEFPSPELIKKFHALGEEVGTGEFGGAACAGAIMVVLNNLLQRYKADLSGANPKWEGIGPQFNGYSLGEVIDAAANNFRHHDEWARTLKPDSRQRKSIAVIEAVLNSTPLSPALGVPWRRNACADLIAVVGGSDFATLEQRFFEFVKAMLA